MPTLMHKIGTYTTKTCILGTGFLVLGKPYFMKRLFFFLAFLFALKGWTQTGLSNILAAGLNDAQKYSTDFLSPFSKGTVQSVANGWYNTGGAKPLGGFEISIIGNYSSFKNQEDKKAFLLNTEDYENLQFVDGSSSKLVSSALGDIEGIRVFVEAEISPGVTAREEFELPSGLAAENINFLPSAYLQASVGLIKGTEIKARFLPKINTQDGTVGLYGLGIQHEFTEHLPDASIFPVSISGVIGYTHLDGTYDFTDSNIIAGANQTLDMSLNSWVFQAVASTKLPIINFYGGLGYISGNSNTDVLGTYIVESGPLQYTYTDPFSIKEKTNGFRANLGAKLKLGFFRLNADYTFAEFNNLSVGINFGFR